MGKIGECAGCRCPLYNKTDTCPNCNGDLSDESSLFIPTQYTKTLGIGGAAETATREKKDNNPPKPTSSIPTPSPTEQSQQPPIIGSLLAEEYSGMVAAEDETTFLCRSCGHEVDQAEIDNENCPFCSGNPTKTRGENAKTPQEEPLFRDVISPHPHGFR